ncbi:hypothetical protein YASMINEVIRUS_241 [Yasminevirus sp. GU-2018]|uniref:Uncharacterized protein n=1 Tax=Yasminevirus sp. GU-2018 TaxID=2420051 RepID=A0A5K0U789_9VIRU|nr:hypothetical protein YASMINEVIRUS_241 [Yasminevirus sp. GU-2018]
MDYQNMQNGYQQQPPQQQMNFGNINPRNFDPKVKNTIVNQNMYHAGYGNYKVCPVSGSIKFPYKSAYNPGTVSAVCKVIVYHKHAIDVADTLSDHGLNSLTAIKPIPAIMYPMGREFTGTNLESREGIYDENIILRSNYPYVIKKQPELFQTKDGQKMVVYSNPISVIRDANYNPLHYDLVFKVGVITLCYERQKDLLTEVEEKDKKKIEKKMLSSADLLTFQIYLENVFQAAICGYHNIMLLPIFGREFGIPVEDQILMYNLCIMKFGHMFKAIIICIPPYEDKGLFEYMDKEILKPQEMTKELDMKYMADNMAKRINQDSEDDGEKRDEIKAKMATMNDDEKLKVIKGMIKKNKEVAMKKHEKRK